jgi:hypothetical protein
MPTPDEAYDQVRDDPALRAVLETARTWGVSPSRFMGREPHVTVVPLQDGGWRHVREPEWTDEDRDMALALAAYESDLCPGCRHPLSETTRPEREELYVPAQPIRCWRCTAASIAGDAYAEERHASALLLQVDLRDPVVVPVE